jgi:ketosteroid isomerase-like protein
VAAAFDARDADEYVTHMTADVVATPPGFLLGQRELHGHEQLRAAFVEGMAAIARGPGRTLETSERRYFLDRADETKVLSVGRMTVTPNDDGEPFGSESVLLFTLTGDSKVSRLESWGSEAEGIARLEDPVLFEE